MQFDETNFIYMLIYIERFLARSPGDFLNPFNIHRLSITCLRLAHKFVDDDLVDPPSLFRRVGGITSAELNKLECDLLERLSFDLYVSENDFLATKKKLSNHARIYEVLLSRQFMVTFSKAEEIRLQQLLTYKFHVPREIEEAVVVAMDTQNTPQIAAATDGLSTSASVPALGLVPGDTMTTSPETEIKRPYPEYDEPIKYSATAQQWFYKKSDLDLDKARNTESKELINQPGQFDEWNIQLR